MRCVTKDLGLIAQNRHEIGRNLQEDGISYIYLYVIYLLIYLNITLEVYNTDKYVENLLQFECSVGMKIERWQLPSIYISMVASSSCLCQLLYLAPKYPPKMNWMRVCF